MAQAIPHRTRKTVLVIEDDPGVRRLVYHALKHGYHVIAAGDADSAFALMDREPVDLVLLDLHLPPQPGTPAVGLGIQARLHELRPTLPVIVASGDEDPALHRELLDRGLHSRLHKPLHPAELVASVNAALGADCTAE